MFARQFSLRFARGSVNAARNSNLTLSSARDDPNRIQMAVECRSLSAAPFISRISFFCMFFSGTNAEDENNGTVFFVLCTHYSNGNNG